MGEAVIINALEQLKPFLNDKNVIEIALRDKNKQFKAFQKVALNDLPGKEEKALIEKAIHALGKQSAINERSLAILQNVAKMQQIGLLLNGLNLCATCAGFAIMYAKLDNMSAELTRQISQVKSVVKKGHGIISEYEFKKVLSEHTDMLDSRKRQRPYDENQMRQLVDQEYNVLTLLIEVFQEDVAENNERIIFSIFSLLSMFTVSLRYFDELYYQNNHSTLGDQNVWHTSHTKWMTVYEILSSEWMIKKLQDYAVFETSLSTMGVDAYYLSLLNQVLEQKEEIEDNQSLIVTLGDMNLVNALRQKNSQEVRESIEAAFSEVCNDDERAMVKSLYNNVFMQVGLA